MDIKKTFAFDSASLNVSKFDLMHMEIIFQAISICIWELSHNIIVYMCAQVILKKNPTEEDFGDSYSENVFVGARVP